MFGANRCDLLDGGLGAGVVANLHVRVFEEVHGMHFVMHHVMMCSHAISYANGREVGVNIVLPKSKAREDVRRHVHGVRGRRRDASVFARGRKSETGHRRIVATVDDVVGDARMIWSLVVKLVEDGNGGFGVGEIGIALGT